MTTEIPGVAGYGANAAALAAQYESITFEEVYRDLIQFLPASPVSVLDVGAGSGRDAAALACRGYQVVAVEPTPELRREGQDRHGKLGIEWVDDHLPSLTVTRQARRRFGLILLGAVWMHLDSGERKAAMGAVAELAVDGAQVFMSLRHGPIPAGRRMFDVSAEETTSLAAEHGLYCNYLSEREDVLGRKDVRWSFLAMQRSCLSREPMDSRRGR